ncbi:GNAT family N-acetyltransferase [soil metagenome]
MHIRKATAEDGAAIAEIHVLCRREMPYAPSPHSEADMRTHFAQNVAPNGHTYVAECEGETVAYLTVENGWIDHLYVHPKVQGRGIGNALLALAKETTPSGLQLWAFQGNEGARRFYEHHGFHLAELTDGQNNEEKSPDVRYVWP